MYIAFLILPECLFWNALHDIDDPSYVLQKLHIMHLNAHPPLNYLINNSVNNNPI